MADKKGYSEDVVSIPDPGLDEGRIKHFDFNGTPPSEDGFKKKFEGLSVPHSLPGEPGVHQVPLTLGENDFPRQTGNDSLTPEEAQLT